MYIQTIRFKNIWAEKNIIGKAVFFPSCIERDLDLSL